MWWMIYFYRILPAHVLKKPTFTGDQCSNSMLLWLNGTSRMEKNHRGGVGYSKVLSSLVSLKWVYDKDFLAIFVFDNAKEARVQFVVRLISPLGISHAFVIELFDFWIKFIYYQIRSNFQLHLLMSKVRHIFHYKIIYRGVYSS